MPHASYVFGQCKCDLNGQDFDMPKEIYLRAWQASVAVESGSQPLGRP